MAEPVAGYTPAQTPVPAQDTLATVAAIANRLNYVTAQRKEFEEEERFLRTRLATLLPMGSTHAGSHTIHVRENRRFDLSTAMAVLTPDEREICSVTTLSASRAREVLPPERYTACQAVTGDPVVRVT
jgi:hypothetical protein